MKLRLQQLAGHLEREQFLPLYIISGDETLLVQEACDTLRQAARKHGFNEREVYHIASGFNWGEVITSVSSLSLFSDKKLLELRFASGKIDDKAKKAISHYLELNVPDTLVMLILPKLEGSLGKSKWFQSIEQAGAHLAIWPVEAHQLGAWLKQRCIRAGFQPTAEAIALLAERVEGNLLAAAQEIEKLRLLMDPGPLNDEAVRRAVAEQSRFDIYGLVDEALKGNRDHALKMLNYLHSSGAEEILLLWTLSKELRTLAYLANCQARGLPLNKAFMEMRIWESRQPIFQRALKNRPADQFKAALLEANRIDQAIKGMLRYNPWIGFHNIVLLLAGSPVSTLMNIAEQIE